MTKKVNQYAIPELFAAGLMLAALAEIPATLRDRDRVTQNM